MTEDEAADTLLPDVPEPPLPFVLVVTVPDEDWERFLPLAPAGGTVTGESVLRMPIKARTLQEAMILGAAFGAWTKAPGARAEVRPA